MTTAAGILLTVTVAAALTAVCAGEGSAQDPSQLAALRERDRCAALEAAADSIVKPGAGRLIALRDLTNAAAERLDELRGYFTGTDIDSTVWRDFLEVNRARRPACRELPSGAPLAHVTESAWAAIRLGNLQSRRKSEEVWSAFFAAFPGARGVTLVSGIGLSQDRRQAILTLAHTCGTQCGTERAFLLGRDENGRWHVTKMRQIQMAQVP